MHLLKINIALFRFGMVTLFSLCHNNKFSVLNLSSVFWFIQSNIISIIYDNNSNIYNIYDMTNIEIIY